MDQNTPYILLAEDDLDDREMFRNAINGRRADIRIAYVDDGPELLTFLQTAADDALPALIILDYKLPTTTAADLLKALNSNRRYISISKLVWSTSDRPEYVDQCIALGASNYFLKPSSVGQLDNMVTHILGTFEFQQSIWGPRTKNA